MPGLHLGSPRSALRPTLGDHGTVGMDGYGTEVPAPRGTGRALLRRPAGLVAQTRWLFTLLAVVSVLLMLPGVLATPGWAIRLMMLAGYAGLVAVWGYRYLSGRAPVVLGVVEGVLVLAVGVGAADPASIFWFLFASLWLRAVYGSTRGAVLHTAILAVAIMAVLPLWGLLADRGGSPPAAAVPAFLSTVPVMFLTVGVARHLVLSLFAREQSQQCDTALVQLGIRLMGLTDRAEIHLRTGECAAAICAATPRLLLLIVLPVDGEAVVVHHAGDLLRAPRTLPTSVLPENPGRGVQPLPDDGPLAELAGTGTRWLGVPFADEAEGWILLGATPRVPTEAVAAIRLMANQVALALRTSDAHLDLFLQASQDPLTGMANRAAFTAELEAGIADSDRPLALLFLDLDDFKIVNDGLGHAAGDDLLRHVAARLLAGVRPEDLCARIGGDEFAVLLRDGDDAMAVGQRLVGLVATPVSLRGHLAHVGASVGLAYAQPGDSGEQLVQQADIAMYAAKAKGKNRVQVFDPTLMQDDGRAQFEAELAAAAAADQLVVHYQPIVSVAGGWCTAVEALVRWQHPTRGLVQPMEFVPTAERTGAILGIGALVLRRACTDAASWSGPSGPLAVHVNVSAAQLTDPDFAGIVRSCIADLAMEPRRLVLEITESMVLDSPEIRSALAALAATGVAIAIDDFGTGYSALSTLRTLPLDIVKIDKSFMTAGPSRAADEAVVEAIVQMAARLGLQIVAEGVEHIEQLQFLRSIGADAAQGYLHLHPTPAPDFGRWLEQQDEARRKDGSITPLGPRRTG